MNRRRFLTGSAGLLLAPAIVRVSSLMPVSVRFPAPFVISDAVRLTSWIMPGAITYVLSTSPVLRAFSYDYEAREYVGLNRLSPRQA